ncbi:hypothetical protein [Noviherbaspirillum massiliense]|uniref:hypothetical protein n=1 Tax=Noviherbaspirillum massiliense TaxID=1465823 RepID=UPI0002F869CD|nr:hypothetical protein [Noviherbaspirillum massiliense]
MYRKILSAEEIRQHVQQLVNAIPEVVQDNAVVNVPLPQWQEPDESGCNWNMKSFTGVRDYDRDIRALLEQARESYNLPQ